LLYREVDAMHSRSFVKKVSPAGALEFTAARMGEILGATWEEVDLVQTVRSPSPRMKAGIGAPACPCQAASLDVLAQVAEIRMYGFGREVEA